MTARAARTVPARAPEPLTLVQAFLNTVQAEIDTDDLADPGTARNWLASHGLLPAQAQLDDRGLARLLAVRNGLRDLCSPGAGNGTGTRDVEDEIGRIPLRARLFPTGRLSLAPAAAGVDGVLGRLLAIVYDAQHDGTWSRLKICGDARCGWAFYDLSRNRSATWCAMAVCGNRTKVAAYRQRITPTAPAAVARAEVRRTAGDGR